MEKGLTQRIEETVRVRFSGEGTGHDFHHLKRVHDLAVILGTEEGAQIEIVELGAWLHDIADWKFTGGDEEVGPKEATKLLRAEGADDATVEAVIEIIRTISFKGAGVATPMKTIEGAVVQDADRLDALGAIGIARCFAYGGAMGRPLYEPTALREMHATAQDYKKNISDSLSHFHEKLYLLTERMNTASAKKMADERTRFVRTFEAQFLAEWEGEI